MAVQRGQWKGWLCLKNPHVRNPKSSTFELWMCCICPYFQGWAAKAWSKSKEMWCGDEGIPAVRPQAWEGILQSSYSFQWIKPCMDLTNQVSMKRNTSYNWTTSAMRNKLLMNQQSQCCDNQKGSEGHPAIMENEYLLWMLRVMSLPLWRKLWPVKTKQTGWKWWRRRWNPFIQMMSRTL